MNKRLMFLIIARSGSSFIRHVLSPNNKMIDAMTDPPAIYFSEDWDPPKHLINDHIKTNPRNQNEIYSLYVSPDFSTEFCDTLYYPGDDWKFVYLIRDPRNRIVSLLSWGEAKLYNKEQKLNLVAGALKDELIRFDHLRPMKNDPRFKICFSEELFKNPLETLQDVFQFAGLQINLEVYKARIDQWKSNSSFEDQGKDSTNRWLMLPEEYKNLIKNQIGKELIEFGFTQNMDW